MRVLGFPVYTPQEVVERTLSDLAAVGRLARVAPAQIDRMLSIGEELVEIGLRVMVIAENLDRRAGSIEELGVRLEARTEQLLDLGETMRLLGGQIDERGAEIVDRASKVVDAAQDLIKVLPTVERALELATPLEGAIDRFGRLVDRLPGGRPAP